MAQGVVKSYDPNSGSGIVLLDTDKTEVYIQPGSLKDSIFRTLRQGQRINFDESGNYGIKPFRVNIQNSLNDEIRTNGLYLEDQKTDEGRDPNDDLMCVKLSSGRAYVRGYDIDVWNKVIYTHNH